MRAVILAGGFGTRLHPVTLEIPKPLLTVKRKPILNHLIEFFQKHGVNEPIVVINKNHRDDYKWWQKRYQKKLPQNLKIKVEPRPLGTFGAMKYLRRDLKEPFVLSNGDELKSFNLRELIKTHKNNPARPIATIALVRVENPSDYGVPIMKGNRILKFIEKPGMRKPEQSSMRKAHANNIFASFASDSHFSHRLSYISSGLYILEPEVFKYADFTKGYLMIEKDIFPKLAAVGKLAGHKIAGGKWQDCGTFARWEKAIKEW